MSSSAALVVPALKKHTGTVLFLHGLGDSGAGWVGLAENWRRRGKFEEIAFVFPNAPSIPITVNLGMRMPGWYDITQFDDLRSAHDEPGILRSKDYILSLIKAETAKGVEPSRIVLGGFSQGGAMSLFTGMTCPHKLAGFFGLSSYLLLHDKIKGYMPQGGERSPNAETPVLMGHGDADPLVRYEWGRRTADVMRELGFGVEFKTYKGLEHSADPKEIDDLETYIRERLPPLEGAGSSKA